MSRWRLTVEFVLRGVAAGLLAEMAWIHLRLWNDGYRHIRDIGPLFLADALFGMLGALAVVAAPRRLVPWAAVAGGLLAAGTYAGLLLSLHGGVLGFHESAASPMVHRSEVVEIAAIAVLLALAVATAVRRSHRAVGATA